MDQLMKGTLSPIHLHLTPRAQWALQESWDVTIVETETADGFKYILIIDNIVDKFDATEADLEVHFQNVADILEEDAMAYFDRIQFEDNLMKEAV